MPPLGGYQQNRALGRRLSKEGIEHYTQLKAGSCRVKERAPMHDLVIRNGKIVDGTGQPARSGDIAIDGGVVASAGGKAGAGRREIDAGGLLMTPGWVDIHSHYDGQV